MFPGAPIAVTRTLRFSLTDKFRKVFERSVVRPFRTVRKKTCRQFPASQMVSDTVAADTLALTGIIRTVAAFEVCRLFALHGRLLAVCSMVLVALRAPGDRLLISGFIFYENNQLTPIIQKSMSTAARSPFG